MAGPWTQTTRNAAAAASVAQAAPATSAGQSVRLRQLSASTIGTAPGTPLLVVRDGATGTGTIIWQSDMSNAITSADRVVMVNCDLRATPGNALTVEFTTLPANTTQAISLSGDFVPAGYPMFGP